MTHYKLQLAASSLARRSIALALPLLLLACKSTPQPSTTTNPIPAATQTTQTPPHPTVPPPPFKLFHQTAGSFTLVTKDTATDPEIAALVWQLRDAAHTHTFDRLHVPQKLVDARDPTVWFHIYRSPRCAAEKYADGPPPCGGSYHAAADYTFGSHANPTWDTGTLLHNEARETPLWNPDTPYTAANSGR